MGFLLRRCEMTPAQSRAARGWLGWSQVELARRANVSVGTVNSFESGQKTPLPNNLSALRRAVEDEGLRLLFDQNGEAVGIAAGDTEGEISRTRRRSRR